MSVMFKNRKLHMLLAACGTTAALSAAASAQTTIQGPSMINISGATLFENFFAAPASTNDFIDVDKDGNARSLGSAGIDQLAPFFAAPNYDLEISPFNGNIVPEQPWAVIYRATGSGTGLAELVAHGTLATADTSTAADGIGLDDDEDDAYYNRAQHIDNGVNQFGPGLYNPNNPGGAPFRETANGRILVPNEDVDPTPDGIADFAPRYIAVDDTNAIASDFIQIDMAVTDVPASWFVITPGTPSPNLLPGQTGFGNNGRIAVDKEGNPVGQDNLLENLGPFQLKQPGVPGTPGVTVYDTAVAFVPIAFPVNYGVGRESATYTELQWGFVSGRLPNGENLTFVTRDSGSGTRNGAINSLCIDPSWGVGENVGNRNSDPPEGTIGDAFVPSNKGGSSALERTMNNTRLGIGHTGAERGLGSSSNPWLSDGDFDVLAVKNDVVGSAAAQFVRPTAVAVTENSIADTAYRIGGPETFITIGDPAAEPVADGGLGNGEPRMDNPQAAAYLNNIVRSIEAFVDTDVPASQTFFTPGEFLALEFTLLAGLDAVQNLNDPCNYIDQTATPAFVQDVQDILQTQGLLANIEYDQFGFAETVINGRLNPVGIVPTRSDSESYGDGAPIGSYVTFGGTNISYGTLSWGGSDTIAQANRISGDFDGNGLRNIDDVEELMNAWDVRNNGGTLTINANISPEIIGDFNNDGFFDRYDIRYWADGLAMNNGTLDRNEGFRLVDVNDPNGTGNFFGTTLATSAFKAYAAGDARGDLANADSYATTRGWAPSGAEGFNRNSTAVSMAAANRIDEWDIEYVFDQFRGNDANGNPVFVTDDESNWGSNLIESGNTDLSADLTGDRAINIDDAAELIVNILGTSFADVNLDGIPGDAADIAIVNAAIAADPNNPLFTEGDVNGDDVIDATDLAIVQGTINAQCPGDLNGDGAVTPLDISIVLGAFGNSNVVGRSAGDANGDGAVTPLDISIVLGNFGTSCI